MRLFFALLRRKNMPNGHIHRGKDQIIKPVTSEDYFKLKRQLEVEEQNMFYLRHAYLTLEQSHGHAQALNKHEESYRKNIIEKQRDFYNNVTIEDRLGHTRCKEEWE